MERAQQFALTVWQYKQGEMVSLMIHLGDRLGLIGPLAEAPHTPATLAESTDLDERWVREWCLGMAAADLVERDDDTYSLSPEAAAVLADENNLFFATGAFAGGIPPEHRDRIVEAFRTGAGFTYGEMGGDVAAEIDRMNHPNLSFFLVPAVIEPIGDLTARLDAEGGDIVDIGCGGGLAVAAMARRFPKAKVVGYDVSDPAIERATARLTGIPNAAARLAASSTVPENSVDLVTTLDVMHDVPHPAAIAADIKRMLKPDGVWVIKEIRSSGDFEKDRRNPLHAMQYGFSLQSCLGSGTSAEDGAGLGTLGLHPGAVAELAAEAGFTQTEQLRTHDPAHHYYTVRH